MFVECGNCGKRLTAVPRPADPRGVQCPYCGATVPVFEQNTLVSGQSSSAESASMPGELQIDGYEILGRLGEGGMGIVHLARQVSLDRKVAIKVISPALLEDPAFLARFDREIAALVCLSHPNIVTIFDRGRSASGQVYYIMEYIEGKHDGAPMDLERLIADRCLDSDRVRELMLQIVQALGFAHREGIIHRDVKPSNILIDRHGFAKVADFGIASMCASYPERRVTVANQSVGTAMYMSPEQQRDAASVDQRSDIYAAGAMLYQMLTGELPLAGFEMPSKIVTGLSSQWDAIIAKALQSRPENRFADMAAFEAMLRSIGPTPVGMSPWASTVGTAVPNRASVVTMPTVCPAVGTQPDMTTAIRQASARIAVIARENRWCEVSQVLAELQQSGARIKGLDEYSARTRQKLSAVEPLVGMAKSLLEQGDSAQALEHAGRALQQVTDHAEALDIVDLARAQATHRRRGRRLVGGFVAVACLGAVIAGAYLYVTEHLILQDTRQQIDHEDYDAASRTLTDLPHRYFHARDVSYLQAVVDLKKYASTKVIAEGASLERPRQRLKELCDASEAWRTRAESDLKNTVAEVPAGAEDSLSRGLAIARVLDDLHVMDPASLADSLIDKARERAKLKPPALDARQADCVRQILEWNHSLAEKVVDLALSKQGQPDPGLAVIHGWAEKMPGLAGDLGAAVEQVADQHVAKREYEQAKTFVDAAKEIDPHRDAWSFWERYFRKTQATDAADAVKILGYMVQGEHDRKKIFDAVKLYRDLSDRNSGELPPPPPEITDELNRTEFDALIAGAEGDVQRGQYQWAQAKLTDANNRFPSLWSTDEKARTIHDDVRIHLLLEKARDCLKKNDLDTAESSVQEALGIRSEDPQAGKLRDDIRRARVEGLIAAAKTAHIKGDLDESTRLLRQAIGLRPGDTALQTTLDRVEFEQHRRGAEKAVAAGNPGLAVDEIVAARAILEKPSNVSWSTRGRTAMDQLAKTLIVDLHDKAERLSDKRQYQAAAEKVALGLRLSPNDERLTELNQQIETRAVKPETLNLSGIWTISGSVKCNLTDNGEETILFKILNLPEGVRSYVGKWTRTGATLVGEFDVDSARFEATDHMNARATIVDADTLRVVWTETITEARKTKASPQQKTLAQQKATWSKNHSYSEQLLTPPDEGNRMNSDSARPANRSKGRRHSGSGSNSFTPSDGSR